VQEELAQLEAYGVGPDDYEVLWDLGELERAGLGEVAGLG
jgi:hypothetical protein